MYLSDYEYRTSTDDERETDEASIKGFNRINIRFISLDGLSREEVLGANDGVIPQVLSRSFYISKSNSLADAWSSAFKSRKYRYSSKDEVRNQYVYVEMLDEKD